MAQQPDKQLRRAIAWLNNEGGFGNDIQYMVVKRANEGLPFPIVNNIIKALLQERDNIEDPTRWIANRLNEERYNGGEDRWNDKSWPPSLWNWSDPTLDQNGQTRWQGSDSRWSGGGRSGWSESGGGWQGDGNKGQGPPSSQQPPQPPAAPATSAEGQTSGWSDSAATADGGWPNSAALGAWQASDQRQPSIVRPPPITTDELWTRVEWLNNEGGFQNSIRHADVSDAAADLDVEAVAVVLNQLEERWNDVSDPTAFAVEGLSKQRADRDAREQTILAHHSWRQQQLQQQQQQHQQHVAAGGGNSAIRERVDSMNREGGFQGAIDVDAVLKCAKGANTTEALRLLRDLENKREDVTDPTAWACAALQRLVASGNTAEEDASGWDEVRKRIGWLSQDGGFQSPLSVEEVMEAVDGVLPNVVLRVLSNLEEKGAEVSNPTRWVVAALNKERQNPSGGRGPPRGKGGKAGGWDNKGGQAGPAGGVRRPITKR